MIETKAKKAIAIAAHLRAEIVPRVLDEGLARLAALSGSPGGRQLVGRVEDVLLVVAGGGDVVIAAAVPVAVPGVDVVPELRDVVRDALFQPRADRSFVVKPR